MRYDIRKATVTAMQSLGRGTECIKILLLLVHTWLCLNLQTLRTDTCRLLGIARADSRGEDAE
jgi:hypothetical protein